MSNSVGRSALFLLLCALGNAQTASPVTNLVVVVDGSLHPEQIPDDLVWRHFLIAAATPEQPTVDEQRRQSPARAAQAQGKPVAPLSAKSTTNYYHPSGKLAMTIWTQYDRYSDHSLVLHQQQRYPMPVELLSQILDRRTEREIYLDPQTRSATTMTSSRAQQESATSGSWEESCPVEDMANASPGGVFFGHQTLRITKQWAPTSTTERWMIPELDCFTVKEIYSSGGARTEKVVESLQEGEPDRLSAAVPADYAERSPVAVDHLLMQAGGKAAFGSTWGAKLEREYQRRKVH